MPKGYIEKKTLETAQKKIEILVCLLTDEQLWQYENILMREFKIRSCRKGAKLPSENNECVLEKIDDTEYHINQNSIKEETECATGYNE